MEKYVKTPALTFKIDFITPAAPQGCEKFYKGYGTKNYILKLK
jgi:hypothetical protein